jgi:hypothetical protein
MISDDHTDGAPTGGAPLPAHPISAATLARRAGVSRASVSRLLAGKLRPARLGDARVDAGHPLVSSWAARRGIRPAQLLDPAARVEGRVLVTESVNPVAGPCSAGALAARAGASVGCVVDAVRSGELTRALLADGRIDPEHPDALAFLARCAAPVPAVQG